MRIIVITDTSFAASEAESIRILLLEGADRVHLRKPQSAEADMRRLIEALPPELYPRLTLQDHLQLGGYCPGCGGGAGNQACAIARCAMQKEDTPMYCSACSEFPIFSSCCG